MRLRSHGIDVLEILEIGAGDGSTAILNPIQPSLPGQWSPEAEALLMFAAHNDLLMISWLSLGKIGGAKFGRWSVGCRFGIFRRIPGAAKRS
jgi:hypothetical protein